MCNLKALMIDIRNCSVQVLGHLVGGTLFGPAIRVGKF